MRGRGGRGAGGRAHTARGAAIGVATAAATTTTSTTTTVVIVRRWVRVDVVHKLGSPAGAGRQRAAALKRRRV